MLCSTKWHPFPASYYLLALTLLAIYLIPFIISLFQKKKRKGKETILSSCHQAVPRQLKRVNDK